MKTCGFLGSSFLARSIVITRLRADLNGSEADARRVVHGLKHVLDELADTGVDFLDRTRNLPQPLVGQDENVVQRHLRDVSGRRNWVNARHTAVIGTSGAARRG